MTTYARKQFRGTLFEQGERARQVELIADQIVAAEVIETLTDGDSTPSVIVPTSLYKTANTGATTISDFDDGYIGQVITVQIGDANTTVDFTASSLVGNGGADWSPASGDSMRCVLSDDGNWYCTVSSPSASGGITQLTGDVTAGPGSGSQVATIANDAVTHAKYQNIATSTILGRVTASSGDTEELTGTQATTLLDTFTSSLKGLAPASGGGTANYLRADGQWTSPPGGSSSNSFETHTVTDTDVGYTWAATGSVVATGPSDTLTWVSGTDVDIDIDATSLAVRISTVPVVHTGEVTGSTALTLDVSAITNKTDIGLECDPADDIVIHDDDTGLIKKANAAVITDGGYF